jgi:hypothetical protein
MARTVIDETHVEVARVFFALPESAGYAVGGGAAALAHDIVHRATDDLDLFTDRRRVLTRPLDAAEALERAARDRDWGVTWVRRHPDYARLQITTEHASLLVDLVLETLELPATLTIVGPTVAEQDVAVGKLIALFDRAEAATSSTSSSSAGDTNRPCFSSSPRAGTRVSAHATSPNDYAGSPSS